MLEARVVGSGERGRDENPVEGSELGAASSGRAVSGQIWRRRLDGIGLDTATKEFLAIEFKRTHDARSSYAERAIEVAQEQYRSLLTGL